MAFSTYNGGSVSLTFTEWGTISASAGREQIIYIKYTFENTGETSVIVGDVDFNVYADDYSVDTYGSPDDYSKGDVLSARELSGGRKVDGIIYPEVDPDTVNVIEIEYMDAVFVIKDDSLYSSDYSGCWIDSNSQRCVMEITSENDYYNVTIDWSNGASDNSHWEFLAEYDESRECLVYQNGQRTEQHFPDDGGEMEETVVYTDGTGAVYLVDGALYWEDEKDGAGDGCVFERYFFVLF